eukprot:11181-Heterococcus_DN1.PRE.1
MLCAVSDHQLNSALPCLCVLLLRLAGNPTAAPTTAKPTTAAPTTAKPTTAAPTTAKPWWTAAPSTAKPTGQADAAAATTILKTQCCYVCASSVL